MVLFPRPSIRLVTVGGSVCVCVCGGGGVTTIQDYQHNGDADISLETEEGPIPQI